MSNPHEAGTKLYQLKCTACRVGSAALNADQIEQFMSQLSQDWQVVDGHHIERSYKFKDFRQGLDFVNKVGELAEQQGHHPDIYLSWGKVKITLFTHKIDGLHQSDFIMAAKIDQL